MRHFLNHMQSGWNITLFHYRNHGADYGTASLSASTFPPPTKPPSPPFCKTSATSAKTKPPTPPTACS
ncbi:hypothetical protein [Kingella potus]|uniref:hypothetical protein n=1 Tax=Kingella potus TaxID=265175 RepID=UPI001FD53554|nr:hypothetical protein [Kingella potus]UOP01840.1 hypothetical protein LVJ84_02985 [Kingella potus]